MKYPKEPEPHTIEVELTNHCNAQCVFCPNPSMARPKGFIDSVALERFIRRMAIDREHLWLHKVSRGKLPRVVFAGLGEPTLHPKVAELVQVCRTNGFRVQVVSNGAQLSERLARQFIDAGLENLAISLHSLNPEIYWNLMKLDLVQVLPRVTRALSVFEGSGVAVELWRVLPPPGMKRESEEDAARFSEFVARFPWVKVLGPSEPWNRDGIVSNSVWPIVNESARGGIWCHRLFFTYNVAWDGNAVMCCVDYNRISRPLGNVFLESFEEIQKRRAEVFRSANRPEICRDCRRWQDTEYENAYRDHILPNL
jgi:MoaA/NifB/PqqE/SkfB family radical SAM enzyme